MSTVDKKRKTSTPPDGYVCNVCGVAGHWIQQCSKKSNSKRKKSNHVPVPGVDPSEQDIELARQYQRIKPPNCFCGRPSRLKKVKKSNVKEDSRAVGNYFFFCALKKDEQPCRFARPADDQLKDKKERLCPFFAKSGSCTKGSKCMFSHELPDNFERKLLRKRSQQNKEQQQQGKDDTTREQKQKNSQKETNTESGSSSDDSSSSSSSSSSDSDNGSDDSTAANEPAEVSNDSDSSDSGSED
eukprot:scaffold345_cov134-Cylindrotheca_fusiformis.AAC.13